MIRTAEELLGIAKAAEKQKLFASTTDPALALDDMLGLPDYEEVTDETLEQLRPIYVTIIRDMRANKRKAKFLKPILAATKDKYETACVLLYFLSYLMTIRYCRVINLGEKGLQENFYLVDEANEILKTPELQQFCRAVIAQPDQHNKYILSMILVFPSHLSPLHFDLNFASKKEQRLFVEKNIYYGKGVVEGFLELRNDLARLVLANMSGLPGAKVKQTINMQTNLLHFHYGEKDKVRDVMKNSPQWNVFYLALEQKKDDISHDEYLWCRASLGLPYA